MFTELEKIRFKYIIKVCTKERQLLGSKSLFKNGSVLVQSWFSASLSIWKSMIHLQWTGWNLSCWICHPGKVLVAQYLSRICHNQKVLTKPVPTLNTNCALPWNSILIYKSVLKLHWTQTPRITASPLAWPSYSEVKPLAPFTAASQLCFHSGFRFLVLS